MHTKTYTRPIGRNQSAQEARTPGASLKLITEIYPAIFVVGLLVAFFVLGVWSTLPATFSKLKATESRPSMLTQNITSFSHPAKSNSK